MQNLVFYINYELFVWFVLFVVFLFILLKFRFIFGLLKKLSLSVKIVLICTGIFLLGSFFLLNPEGELLEMPSYMHSHAPGGKTASVPILNALMFLLSSGRFEKIDDIGADPNAVPKAAENVDVIEINITAREVISEVAKGSYFNYWTYNNQVPGPMFRVKVGDTVKVTLSNDKSSLHHHNIDLHSVNGPGGGAAVTHVAPGETKSFQWKALNPGLYVYHCAMPNVSTHNSHGQYGLILVEPEGGLPPVDKEFYVMQGELYTLGGPGKKGLTIFDSKGLLSGNPTYITFNGRVETTPRMKAKVGDRVRMYVGNGGVNLISSFHVIGEIFDVVYPEGSMGTEMFKNVQTTAVLPGGAAIVEFTLDVPGKYILVDHALARLNKGAWSVLEVSGSANASIFKNLSPDSHID